MPSIQERHRNNVRAGIFVTVGILLALTVVAVLQDAWSAWLEPRHAYAVTFNVADGVEMLSAGAPVRIGGLEMGAVTDVRLLEESGYEKILVTFELDNDVPLFSNAVAFVKGTLLGSAAWIEIVNIGSAADLDGDSVPDSRIIPPDSVSDSSSWLRGAGGATMLATMLGPESAADAAALIENMSHLSGNISTDYEEQIGPMLASSSKAVADFLARVETDWPHWAMIIERALLSALSASEKMELAMDEGRLLITTFQGGVERMSDLVERNSPSVDFFVANLELASADVRDIAGRIADTTVDRVEALLDRGQDGMDSFARTMRDIEVEFDIMAPALQDSAANIQIGSTQLKLAVAELRASPWRLLYRPGREELEYENLYFAANKFALAVADLKLASESVERAITQHREYLRERPEELERMQQTLADSLTRYEEAQERLLSILSGSEP
jgi:ABC-type transporter Mla subunit MlaD